MDVIEWFDTTGREIVHRYPPEGSADITFGSQLVVRENQAAIFFRDGKGLDVLGPGRHTLSTQNLPVLTKVLSLPWGFTSPFRAEVLFVSQKVFTNMRWGTKDPVAFKDRELGLIRLRGFGTFTMQVTQPLLFVNAIVGTQASFDTGDIEDYLRDVIVSRVNDFLGEFLDSLLDLPKSYDAMAVAVKTRLGEDFRKYGMELVDFYVNRITPPDDVEKMIDERAGMAAVGDLDRFMKFKAAKAIGDAATAGAIGGEAAGGLGLGVGAGLGMMLPGMVFKTLGVDNPTAADIAAKGTVNCPACHADVPLNARFCAACGHQLVVTRKCARCGQDVTATARFCPSCGVDLGAAAQLACPSCHTVLPPGTRFCLNCGERIGQPSA